jgi:hypothetical protein
VHPAASAFCALLAYALLDPSGEEIRMTQSNRTIDHDEIRAWVEERGGKPATVKRTSDKKGPGILRIDFPGYSGEGTLEEISWEDFFAKFEEAQLAFVYQVATADGEMSRFSKLVKRSSEDEEQTDDEE